MSIHTKTVIALLVILGIVIFITCITYLIRAWRRRNGRSDEPIPQRKEYTISGAVFNKLNELIPYQPLVAYYVDLVGAAYCNSVTNLSDITSKGGMQRLNPGTSDESGNYTIKFFDTEFTTADVGLTDIIVYAIDNQEIIGRSAISKENSVTGILLLNWNVTLEKSDKRGESEYKKLVRIIEPFVKKNGLQLYQLSDSIDQLSFLANETGQDLIQITDLVKASAFMTNALSLFVHERAFVNPNIPNPLELFYGLVRQNIALNWILLAITANSTLQKAIKTSISSNIIKTYDDEAIDKFLTDLETGALKFTTQTYANGNLNDVSKTLSFSLGADTGLQSKYLSSYRNFTGSAADFWKTELPKQGFQPNQIGALQLTTQLGLLTNNHLPLIEELQVNRKIASPADLIFIADSDWKAIIDKTGIPGKPEGASDADKTGYISSLQAILNTALPNLKVASLINLGNLSITDDTLSKGLVTFLSQQTDFNILNTSAASPAIKLVLDGIHPDAFKKLNYFQRILQVSPTPQVLTTLVNENILQSSRDIAAIPPKNFMDAYADKLGGPEMASLVHNRARFLTKRNDQIFMSVYNSLRGITPAFSVSEGNKELLGSDSTGASLNTVQDYFPNWENLFGATNIYDCEDCQSITSPAAYLVDLLKYLSVSKTGSVSALDVLFTRRPDLGELPLSCENTNTVIPYIDLVNEIMEYYTANGGLTLNPYKGYDTGDATTEELHANPQNTDKDAYRILSNNTPAKKSVYPFTLPYHQPLDRIRIYLAKLQTSRDQLMDIFRKDTDQDTTNAINAEFLTLSPEEYQILIDADASNVFQYYGYADNNTMLAAIINAQTFIRKAGINYTDLVNIVETRFINPGKPQFIYVQNLFLNSGVDAATIFQKLKGINGGTDLSAGDPTDAKLLKALHDNSIVYAAFKKLVTDNFVNIQQIATLFESADDITNSGFDISKTFLKTIQSLYDPSIINNGITAVNAGTLHRFIRLWRKLGWDVNDLDTVIIALDEADINAAMINKLATFQKINGILSLPFQQLCCLWGVIDTYGGGSLYNQLFLSRAIKEIDPAFQPDALGTYFKSNDQLVSDHITVILAAMKLNSDDLSLILNDYPFGVNSVLSLENLSAIYRYVLLARGTSLTITDFVTLKALSGINPFPAWDAATGKFINVDPQSTLAFIEMAQKVVDSGFSVAQISYIVNGTDTAGKIGLQQALIFSSLVSLQAAVIKVNRDNPDTDLSNATEDLFRKRLQLLFTQDIADSFFSLMNSKVYNVPAPEGLALSKSPPNIQYNAAGSLQCTGIMGDDLQSALNNLKDDTNTAVPQSFIDAVTALYVLPDVSISDFINTNFSGFISTANVPGIIKDIKKNQSILLNPPLNLYNLMYSYFLPYLKNILCTNLVVQQISTLIGLEEPNANILLGSQVHNIILQLSKPGLTITADSADALALAAQIVIWYKAALFISGFKLTSEELSYFISNNTRFDNLDLSKLTFQHWSRLTDYAALRNEIAPTPTALIKIFEAAAKTGATIQAMIDARLLDGKVLPQLNAWFSIADVADFQDEVTLTRLNKALTLVQALGIPVAKLAPPLIAGSPIISWALPTTDFDQLWDIAEDIKRTLKAKYTDDDWLLLSKNLSNEIRENQKQALIAWLLVQPELQLWGVADADGLFEYLLIDVQMDACMDTSRVVQALSSIQLFVDRILLNLETNRVYSSTLTLNLTPDSIDGQWAWRKYYRVWQAAREVFLYPENWLQPELRDDKSSFFKDLESDLLQNDITADSVDNAFRNYLTGLEQVANLDVWGMFQADPSNVDSDIYAFARTHHVPYSYYWRTRKNGEWSTWDPIPVDVRGVDDIQKPGVHLVPVFWKNQVILFWPEFTPKSTQSTAATSSTDTISSFADNAHFSDLSTSNYWEIRLAWSEHKNGKWQPKVLSKEALIPGYINEQDGDGGQSYFFQIPDSPNNINMTVSVNSSVQFNFFVNMQVTGSTEYNIPGGSYNLPVGSIVLNSLHNKLQIIESAASIRDESDLTVYPSDFGNFYIPQFEKWERIGSLHLFNNDYLVNTGDHSVLPADQVTNLSSQLQNPFFFQDLQRAYFVEPGGAINYSVWIADPSSIPPTDFLQAYPQIAIMKIIQNNHSNG